MDNELKPGTGPWLAANFLQSLRENDAIAFWDMLDNMGKGFFYGMWLYAMGNMTVSTIKLLSQDHTFLQNALEPILVNIRESLKHYLVDSKIGDMEFVDNLHARVPVFSNVPPEPGEEESQGIPLVLELSPGVGDLDAGQGLTRWRVDILSCLQIKLE